MRSTFLQSINLDIIRLSWGIGALGVFTLISVFFKTKIGPLIIKLCSKTQHKLDDIFANGFIVPFTWLVWFFGVVYFLDILPSALGISVEIWYTLLLTKVLHIGLILFFAWGFWRSSDASTVFISHIDSKLDITTRETVQRFIINVIKICIIAVAVVLIAGEFISNISGLVAGLGLGGITVALAAKETASNFFGGIVIVFDKPFEIGDWISCGANEGIVEDINLRCTKIRTFQNAITMVPNAKLTSEAITNWSRMQMRRATDIISVSADTKLNVVTTIVHNINRLLNEHKDICENTSEVFLDGISYGYYKISISYYTHHIEYAKYIIVKNDVNIQIAREIEMQLA